MDQTPADSGQGASPDVVPGIVPGIVPSAAPTNSFGQVPAANPLAPRVLAWWTREKTVMAVLAILFLVNWWDTRRQIGNLSQEVAQRLKAESESLQQQGRLAREAEGQSPSPAG